MLGVRGRTMISAIYPPPKYLYIKLCPEPRQGGPHRDRTRLPLPRRTERLLRPTVSAEPFAGQLPAPGLRSSLAPVGRLLGAAGPARRRSASSVVTHPPPRARGSADRP